MTDDEMERFEQLYRLAERLIVEATKGALAKAARNPELNLALPSARPSTASCPPTNTSLWPTGWRT